MFNSMILSQCYYKTLNCSGCSLFPHTKVPPLQLPRKHSRETLSPFLLVYYNSHTHLALEHNSMIMQLIYQLKFDQWIETDNFLQVLLFIGTYLGYNNKFISFQRSRITLDPNLDTFSKWSEWVVFSFGLCMCFVTA